MAVLSGATASIRNLYSGTLTTTANTVVYTAKGYTINVTSDSGVTNGTTGVGSATAIVKEIAVANATGTAATVAITINGTYFMNNVTVNANDTKVFSGLNTMLNAGATIQAWSGTANAISCIISGQEVQ